MEQGTKVCFKCQQCKPLSCFYAHQRMADGHLNKCIDCAKSDVRTHRTLNAESVSRYEQQRSQTPHRKALQATYLKSYRTKNPEKNRARQMVNRHLRAGNLTKKPCVYCGGVKKVEAHHEDYSKPLEVLWVCFKCHREREHHQTVTQAS